MEDGGAGSVPLVCHGWEVTVPYPNLCRGLGGGTVAERSGVSEWTICVPVGEDLGLERLACFVVWGLCGACPGCVGQMGDDVVARGDDVVEEVAIFVHSTTRPTWPGLYWVGGGPSVAIVEDVLVMSQD